MEIINDKERREALASLLFRLKQKIDVRKEILDLSPEEDGREEERSRYIESTVSTYSSYINEITSIPTLWALIRLECGKSTFRTLILLIERLLSLIVEESDHIFSSRVAKAVIYTRFPKIGFEYDSPEPFPSLTVKLLGEDNILSTFPYFWLDIEIDERKRKTIYEKIEKYFRYCSDFKDDKGSSWILRIQDDRNREFYFSGTSIFFPYWTKFSIHSIPHDLGIKDLRTKDRITSLSMNYTRISGDRKKETCERFSLDEKTGRIRVTKKDEKLDLNVSIEKETPFIRNLLFCIDLYSFSPLIVDGEDEEKPDIEEMEGCSLTQYFLRADTFYGRSLSYDGAFNRYGLPYNWSKIAEMFRKEIFYTSELECLDPSLADLPRITKDSVFVVEVAFSPDSKLYSYIAPDDSFIPGTKALVPVGDNGSLKVVTVKKLVVYSAIGDKEFLNRLKKIVSHYPKE